MHLFAKIIKDDQIRIERRKRVKLGNELRSKQPQQHWSWTQSQCHLTQLPLNLSIFYFLNLTSITNKHEISILQYPEMNSCDIMVSIVTKEPF